MEAIPLVKKKKLSKVFKQKKNCYIKKMLACFKRIVFLMIEGSTLLSSFLENESSINYSDEVM